MQKMMTSMILASSLVMGCGDDSGDDNNKDHRDASIDASVRSDGGLDAALHDAARDAAGDAASVLSESQVVGLAGTINDGEIELGQLAASKATSTSVKAFAEMMVTMHTAANQRAVALGVARAESATANQVEQMVTTVRSRLEAAEQGVEFDRAYVESQVLLHTAALESFDTVLLPNATTPALVAELTRTRGEVVTHLNEAKALRGDGGS